MLRTRSKSFDLTALSVGLVTMLTAQSTWSAGTDIVQNSNNAATVTVDTAITGVGDLGTSASSSISASGAIVSVNVSGVNADFTRRSIGIGLVDMTGSNSGAVSGTGSITLDAGATTLGDAASVAIGASGSTVGLSIKGVGPIDFSIPTMAGVGQEVATNSAGVSASGTISASTVDLGGTGSSASVSAVGANAAFSTTGIGASSFGGSTFGDSTTSASQTATNDGLTANVTNTDSSISVGSMTGDAASAAIVAKGASAAVSMSTIGTTAATANDIGVLTQTAENATTTDNSGTVTITGGSITVDGAMTGIGASASISAAGATASYSLASIADTAYTVNESLTDVPLTQTATNGALGTINIDSTNSITLGGGDLGVSSSAAISAVGAGTYLSFSATAPTP